MNINDLGSVESHDLVDLELPSGNKWATMNIGAKKVTETGLYYAWGEVAPKGNYVWETYEWGTSAAGVTKYNATDGKTTLDPVDDAAVVNWGGNWIMPSQKDWDELISKCYCEYVTSYDNGIVKADVKGYVFYMAKDEQDKGKFKSSKVSPVATYNTAPETKTVNKGTLLRPDWVTEIVTPADLHIFIPIAGHQNGTSVTNESGSTLCAQYWSSTVMSDGNACQYFETGSNKGKTQTMLRCYGLQIRPIIAGSNRNTTGN